jgi:hypothetical protein
MKYRSRTASAYSRMLLLVMLPPFGNTIFEATIPFSVTIIMSQFGIVPIWLKEMVKKCILYLKQIKGRIKEYMGGSMARICQYRYSYRCIYSDTGHKSICLDFLTTRHFRTRNGNLDYPERGQEKARIGCTDTGCTLSYFEGITGTEV